MLPEMIKVTVLADGTRYDGRPLNIGDRIEIPDHLVGDWVRAGIARVGWFMAETMKPKAEEPKKARGIKE